MIHGGWRRVGSSETLEVGDLVPNPTNSYECCFGGTNNVCDAAFHMLGVGEARVGGGVWLRGISYTAMGGHPYRSLHFSCFGRHSILSWAYKIHEFGNMVFCLFRPICSDTSCRPLAPPIPLSSSQSFLAHQTGGKPSVASTLETTSILPPWRDKAGSLETLKLSSARLFFFAVNKIVIRNGCHYRSPATSAVSIANDEWERSVRHSQPAIVARGAASTPSASSHGYGWRPSSSVDATGDDECSCAVPQC